MKKAALLFAFFVLGLLLVSLRERIAEQTDRILFQAEMDLKHASALIQQGKRPEFEKALKDFVLKERGSEKLRSIAFYNLGTSLMEKASNGDSTAGKDALFYLRESLRNDPSLFPARYNLELLLDMKGDPDEKKQPSTDNESTETEENSKAQKAPTPEPSYLGKNP
jgi:hypothetical protein